jgi:hypothetical protein
MRADQIARLRELSEKLADVVLEEADPAEWPGAGTPLAALTQQERGDRFWCKRNASATFALLERSESMLADATEIGQHGRLHDRPELEDQIRDAEKRASAAVARALDKAKSKA